MLTFADEIVRVKAMLPETEAEIAGAMALLAEDAIDENSWTCLLLSKGNHCDSFGCFNRHIPEPSIYSLPRLSQAKRNLFVNEVRFSLDAIDPADVTPTQLPVLTAHQSGAPYINLHAIERFLGDLNYPLHFLDDETYASAIPIMRNSNSNTISIQHRT